MKFLIFLTSALLLLSFAGVGLMRRLAYRFSALDVPNDRSAHTRPTPRGGGLPIVVLAVSGLLVLWWHEPSWPPAALAAYAAGALVIAAVGFVDDLRQVSRAIRLLCQLSSAALVIAAFGYWKAMPVPVIGTLGLGPFGLVVTLIWILGLANAFNFMDGADGLAGSQAAIAGLAWAAFGFASGQYLVGGLGALVAAGSLGFLAHNWAPAHIFMGDVGSVFLGYTFAALPLIAAQTDPRLAFCGPLVVWPFVFDTAFTMGRRALRGETIWTPHRSHLYQRLLPLGYSHRFISIVYALLSLTGVAFSWLWLSAVPGADAIIAFGLPLLAAVLWWFVVRQERLRTQPARTPAVAGGIGSRGQ